MNTVWTRHFKQVHASRGTRAIIITMDGRSLVITIISLPSRKDITIISL